MESVPKHPRPFTLAMISAVADRLFLVTMAIADYSFAIVAIGIVCTFFYLRESIFAYRLTSLILVSFLLAQLFCNKWLRKKRIANQALLLNLYLTAVAVSAMQRDIWRETILGFIFVLMSLRCSVEILRRLRLRPAILPSSSIVKPDHAPHGD